MISTSLVFTTIFIALTNAKKLPNIYWNTTNPMMEVFAEIGDRVDIICPHIKRESGRDSEMSVIYRVTEKEFMDCRLGMNAEEVGRCINPFERSTLNIAFRTFSPNPYALEYKPDQTYFFISTSDGSPEGLNNKIGGLCDTHAMKMMVHLSEKNGHKHRHHHKKMVTTSTTEVSRVLAKIEETEPRKEENVMWAPFYEKMSKQSPPPSPLSSHSLTRGERVPLDLLPLYPSDPHRLDVYEQEAIAAALEDRVEFEIHEIGDVENLAFSSSCPVNVLSVVCLIVCTLSLW